MCIRDSYGTVPFKAANMPDLHKLIIKGRYTLKASASKDVRDLLRRMLEVDPKKRFTIPQILCHKWFADYDPTVEIFTQEEKMSIRNEFTYSQRTNRNQMHGEGSIVTVDSDWFIEQSIDSSQSDLNRNISSKSIILAPFNSTLSHQSDTHESIKELIIKGKPVKYSAKVKNINGQYEILNNSKMDGGIYKVNDTQNSETTEDLDPFGNNGGSMEEDQKEEDKAEPEVKIHEEIRKTVQEMLLNSLKPKPLVIDKRVVKKTCVLGYPEDYLVRCLKDSQRNYATTTYYLIKNS
eukprot:TRINITY_DN1107_c0_g2_i3.p1 TRINITY_DN1107_c0_g2~~TRINITY_DN1107_c0_g2_i3.p1  ORF type:complete len:293 (+),score=76.81 TRINITY_DN1107_c0_g2_i3:74-952(+)